MSERNKVAQYDNNMKFDHLLFKMISFTSYPHQAISHRVGSFLIALLGESYKGV